MNERIKELSDKCGLAWTLKTEQDVKNLVEFSELIVRECAELIDNKVTITAAQTYDEVFVAKYDTKELCAQQIKEHFGVE